MKTLPILLLLLLPIASIQAQTPSPTVPSPRARHLTALVPSSDFDSSDSDERNLIVNGDFEHGTHGWELIAFAKKGRMTIDRQELHNGKPTLRIDNTQGDQSFVRQIVKGKPNTRYRLSGYIMTRNVEPVKLGGRDGAVLMVGMTLDMTSSIQKTTPWAKVSINFTPKKPNEIRVGPSLGTYARYVTGTAWFSDLTLTELGGDEKK